MQKIEEFKPLYKELINCFGSEKWNGKIQSFFIQEGKNFKNSDKKVLFVGK